MTGRSPHPLIGISPRLLRNLPPEMGFRGKTLQYLEQSVAHFAMAEGALVVMVPTVERESIVRRSNIDVPDYVDALDGLILQGGADIDPSVYGEARTPAVGPSDSVRDRFELDLVRAFVAADKPVLGICRGMQLINVALGGTLHQDLVQSGVTSRVHTCPAAYDEHAHAVVLEPGGWLDGLYADTAALTVNSIHHQGVRTLGAGLAVEARSDDGVVEAIRCPDARFLVGVQWHPEFHDVRFPHLLPAEPLMRAFLAACRL